jgi:transcriptional regulator with XRE-family HTH domain
MSDPDYLELVAALRSRREEKGLTQQRLAGSLGRPQSFVAKYESCERRLDIIDVLRICRVLNLRLRDVLPASWHSEL